MTNEISKATTDEAARLQALTENVHSDKFRLGLWFARKALAKAQATLDLLEASEEAGGWLPYASTKVRAALSPTKSWTAKALSKRAGLPYPAARALRYGGDVRSYNEALASLVGDISKFPGLSLQDRQDVYAALSYFRVFASRAADLDNSRPKPVITALGVSPTITATLKDMGVDGRPETVRVCPIEWHRITRIVDGVRKTVSVGYLTWPANVQHATSRFARVKRDEGAPCEACGHSIRNGFNWVPLLIDDAQGRPRSLWVGRDCAHNVFGFKVTGELEYEGRTP